MFCALLSGSCEGGGGGGGGTSLPSGTGFLVGYFGATQTYAVIDGKGIPYLNDEGTDAGNAGEVIPNGVEGQALVMGPDGRPIWGAGGNPWAGLEIEKGLPYWSGAGEPNVALLDGSLNAVELRGDNSLGVCAVLGRESDGDLLAKHKSYNKPQTGTLTVDKMGRFGFHEVKQWAATGSAFTRVIDFPTAANWHAVVDVRGFFMVGTTSKRIQRTYQLKRTGSAVTATELGTVGGTSEGDTVATVAIALSVVSGNVTLTLTPTTGATTCSWSLDGDLAGL